MSKKDKNDIYKMALKLNLILGLYNMLLFSLGDNFYNLIIGSMNIGVWTFFRDKKLVVTLLKNFKIKNKYNVWFYSKIFSSDPSIYNFFDLSLPELSHSLEIPFNLSFL